MFTVTIESGGVQHTQRFSHEGRARSYFREWANNARDVYRLRRISTVVTLSLDGTAIAEWFPGPMSPVAVAA